MNRRRLIRLLVLAFLAAFIVWLEPTRVVWGWLRGEAFYQGRPTGWWSKEIGRWQSYTYTYSNLLTGVHSETCVCSRPPTPFEAFLGRFVTLPEPTWPTLLDGDRAGTAVLQELQHDPSRSVRNWAEDALRRAEPNYVAPGRRVIVPHSRFQITLGILQ